MGSIGARCELRGSVPLPSPPSPAEIYVEVGGAGAGERLPCNPLLMCRRDASLAATPPLAVLGLAHGGLLLNGDEGAIYLFIFSVYPCTNTHIGQWTDG